MKLSLCIATYNEEKFIHYPLDSAIDLVDEVIIVDGGSTDRTAEVAKKYGEKVKAFVENNPPMFHINKQKAIEKAGGEWILQLDADEELSEELKKEIKSIVKMSSVDNSSSFTTEFANEKVAYYVPRKNFFLTRFLEKGGQYPDYTIRLYKRGAVRFPCKSVHENVEVNGNVGYLKGPLLHYADKEFSRYLNRWNRYTSLDAEELIKKGEKPCFLSYFCIKPKLWFFNTYIRHKGFMDGFPGFAFALFSSIRFWAIYVKVWQKKHKK